MRLDLFALLSKFKKLRDVETEEACFLTHVPFVAPEAYLNIVYKATSSLVVDEVDRDLRLPPALREFYREWNGACFFADSFAIFGCMPRDYRVRRSDPFSLPPYDIRVMNSEVENLTDGQNLLCIGAYSFDGSLVFIDRRDGSIACYAAKKLEYRRQRWDSLWDWVSLEIGRFSLYFDEDGQRQVDKSYLLPGVRSN